MMDWLKQVHGVQEGTLPACRAGDQVRVWYRIQERGRVRTAPFEGTVIRLRGSGHSKTMTVRRVTFGEGVERVFQLGGPMLDRVEIVRRGRVRRSRLYFLRTIVGKARLTSTEVQSANEHAADPSAAAERPSGSDEPSA